VTPKPSICKEIPSQANIKLTGQLLDLFHKRDCNSPKLVFSKDCQATSLTYNDFRRNLIYYTEMHNKTLNWVKTVIYLVQSLEQGRSLLQIVFKIYNTSA